MSRIRKKSCEILIEDCEEFLVQITDKFRTAFQDPQKKEIVVSRIKNFSENCRSILEYIAQDIFEITVPEKEKIQKLKINKNVYFPYGKKKSIFRSSISKNLPGLKQSNKQIYELIEELQDYRRPTQKAFLTYMCRLTNDNKHDDLTDNERQSSKYIKVGQIGVFGENSDVFFKGNFYNGEPMGDFSIRNGEIQGDINPHLLSETIQYEEGAFVFKDTKKNVLEFLQLSLNEIRQFTDDLYKILEAKDLNTTSEK